MKKYGKYEILETLGSGAMGTVFKARDTILDRLVALKVMASHLLQDREFQQRFLREAQAAGRLHHPNIVTIYEQGESDGYMYIAMEFLEGHSLDEILHQGSPVPLRTKLEWVIQICNALEHAHIQGLVHRDIKPANIRVLSDGTIKIVDFGIVRTSDSKLTGVGEFFGSPSYMSPEQLRSSKDVDGRSDLFSIGIILYELLAGRLPFHGDNITALYMEILNTPHPPLLSFCPEAPADLAEIVDRALDKDRERRFQTCEEMSRQIQIVRQRLPITGPPAATRQETRQLTRQEVLAVAQPTGEDLPLPPPSVTREQQDIAIPFPAPSHPPRSFSGKRIGWGAVGALLILGILYALLPRKTAGPTQSPQTPPVVTTLEWSPATTLPAETSPTLVAFPTTSSTAKKLSPTPTQITAAASNRTPVTTTLMPTVVPLVEAVTERTLPISTPPPSETIPQKTEAGIRQPEEKPPAKGVWRDPATGLDLVWIPPGEFSMGCAQEDSECESNESPQHQVTISKGFWMGKYEITQAQWRSITGNNPSALQGDTLPVEQVSWNEVQAFLVRLNAAGGGMYRLPTEAEWEYAARSGSTSSRYGQADLISWHAGNSQGKSQAVGRKAPNAWGLHDMLGNVWEWCQDGYDKNYYKKSSAVDPTGPSSGKEYVIRGGSFANSLGNARCSYRMKFSASQRGSIGFRVVRMPSS